jgi:cysteine-rich repeat protein
MRHIFSTAALMCACGFLAVACSAVEEPTPSDDDAAPLEPVCGDGYLSQGEECEDGNTEPGDGCDPDCNLEPTCGNGFLDPGELCDDGNTDPGDGCDENCRIEEPECGNGVLEDPEECDDGNTVPGDGCDEDCMDETRLDCGPEIPLLEFLDTGGGSQSITGDTGGENDDVEPPDSCVGPGYNRGSDVVLRVGSDRYARGTFTTDDPGTQIDTVLMARRRCLDPSTEYACNDEDPAATRAGASTVVLDFAPGDRHFLWVDTVGLGGPFVLRSTWTPLVPPGDPCDPTGDLCAPRHRCDPVSETCVPGRPPRLDAGLALAVLQAWNGRPGSFRFVFDGADPDRDLAQVRFTLIDGTGTVVGSRSFPVPEEVNDAATFAGARVLWDGVWSVDPTARTTDIEILLVDALGIESNAVTVPVEVLPERVLGDPCDPTGWLDECEDGTTCGAANPPPVCEAAESPQQQLFEAYHHLGDIVVVTEVSDPNGDVVSWTLQFRDVSNAITGYDADQDGVQDTNYPTIAPDVPASFNGFAQVRAYKRLRGLYNERNFGPNLATVWSYLRDASNAITNAMGRPISPWPVRGLGAACDPMAFLDLCGTGDCVDPGTGPACAVDPDTGTACAAASPIGAGTWSGSTLGQGSLQGGSCMASGPARFAQVAVTSPSRIRVTIDPAGTDFDAALFAREFCDSRASELACTTGSELEFDARAGVPLSLGVASASGSAGNFSLGVEIQPLRFAGDACDPSQQVDACARGLICLDLGGGPECW